MNINDNIRGWAKIVESQLNEISDIDVDQNEWDSDMGRSEDRFDNEFIKKSNEKHAAVYSKIESLNNGSKFQIILWLMDILEKSFDTKVEFDKRMDEIMNGRYGKFKMSSIHKDILDAISHHIGEVHYQKVNRDIKDELD